MSMLDDIRCKPTAGEVALCKAAADAQARAESLEEDLMVIDPREATDQAVHSRVCYMRQIAAHAWRRATALQSQLNGAESRRRDRSMAIWMVVGFVAVLFKIDPTAAITAIFKALSAL